MSVRMRANRSHTKNRRSHHKVSEPRISVCADCKSQHLRHHVCENCGKYRGRLVVDVVAQMEKRAERLKRKGEKIAEQNQDKTEEKSDEDTDKAEGKLNAAELSQK